MSEDTPTEQLASPRRSLGRPARVLISMLAVTALVTAAVAMTHHRSGNGGSDLPARREAAGHPVANPPSIVPAAPVSGTVLRRLPQATTDTRLLGAPVDRTPYAPATGTVAQPTRTVPVYVRPGGSAVAALPVTQIGGSPTWLPVVATQPGWLAVLLPSKPNHTMGWITTLAIDQAHTEYRIEVALHRHRLTLYRNGRTAGTWPVSAGTASTPTPTGRTFLLAEVHETRAHYSPVIWPLGAHSSVLEHFAGGPGTVAIHGWPDPAVFGHDHSNGCVRIPDAGMRALAAVPLGSLVTITH